MAAQSVIIMAWRHRRAAAVAAPGPGPGRRRRPGRDRIITGGDGARLRTQPDSSDRSLCRSAL
eukprot:751629-Hanusia_phi.AAC.1